LQQVYSGLRNPRKKYSLPHIWCIARRRNTMKEFFRQVLSGFGYRHRQTSIGKPFRRVRPNLELLEGRDLASISSNLVPTVSASLGGPSTLQGPTPVVLTLGGGPVQKGPTLNFAPNMTGATFIMYYGHDYTGSFHIFKITNMTGVPGSSNQFTFNGFWD